MFDRQQIRNFVKSARAPYGPAWKLMSDDQRQAVIYREAMRVLLAQAMEKYEPAQDLVRAVIEGMEKEDGR